MSKHDVSYFQLRAESELELAQRATHPAAVRAHYQLAEMYLDKVYGSSLAFVEDRPESPANDAVPDRREGPKGGPGRKCA